MAILALERLYEDGYTLCFGPQNIIEFWSVATRPSTSRGGLGLAVTEAEKLVTLFRDSFEFVAETPAVFEEWHRLVNLHGVSGVQAHDARIVALMNIHSITHILTFNTSDFARYGLTAVLSASLI